MDYDRYTKQGGKAFVADARAVLEQTRRGEEGAKALLAKFRETPGVKVLQDTVMFDLEDDVPLPAPKGAVTGRVVMPHGFSEMVPRFKSLLVVTILECGPVFVLQARGPRNHVVQFTNERGVVGFASREDAKLFMPDVCAQYWRRYG